MLFLLLIFFLFPFQVRAEEATPSATPLSLTLVDLPDAVILGDTFDVKFSLLGASASEQYYVKIYGGVDNNNNDLKTVNQNKELNYTGTSWTEFPVITSDSNGSYSGSIIAKTFNNSGNYTIKAKLALVTKTSAQINTSDVYSIEVIEPEPTSTDTPNPTKTPTPTKIPTPTKTPTPKPTNTLVSTITPTPSPSPTDTITTTPSPDPEVLGDSDVGAIDQSPVPTPSPTLTTPKIKSSPTRFIPIVFMLLGGSLMLTPLIISKFKKDV